MTWSAPNGTIRFAHVCGAPSPLERIPQIGKLNFYRPLVLHHVHERDYVLLENDTLLHPNWLPPLLECMREERAAVVAPLLLDFWEGTIYTTGGMFAERK